jgi:hypothetical protein
MADQVVYGDMAFRKAHSSHHLSRNTFLNMYNNSFIYSMSIRTL